MSNKGSILIIDDEESIRVTVSEFLADEGYDVTAADSFSTALELLDAGVSTCCLSIYCWEAHRALLFCGMSRKKGWGAWSS